MGENHHIVMHIFENKYGGMNLLRVGLIENQDKQMHIKKIMFGYGGLSFH